MVELPDLIAAGDIRLNCCTAYSPVKLAEVAHVVLNTQSPSPIL